MFFPSFATPLPSHLSLLNMIRQNSCQAWYLAARPKTLSGALVSVFCATALAFRHGIFSWRMAVLCALFASLMQVASNFINDLYDFLRGTDGEDRLGPERACAQGWISPIAMRRGIWLVCIAALLTGIAIIVGFCHSDAYDVLARQYGIGLVIVAFAAVIITVVGGAFFYTTYGSYHGLGDLLVYVFFGYVPTCGTYLVLTGRIDWEVLLLSTAVALVVDTLLVVNNYRDRHTDRAAGKQTLIARFGSRFGEQFYFWQGFLAWVCASLLGLHGHYLVSRLVVVYVLFHLTTWRELKRIHEGRSLNVILGKTSRNMLIFTLLLVLSLMFETL